MERIEPTHIAHILARTPAWARADLAAIDPRTRQRAIDVVAAIIAERLLDPPVIVADHRQIALPIVL